MDAGFVRKGFRLLSKLITIKTGMATFEEVVQNYSGTKKGRYKAAQIKLVEDGFSAKLARVSMFIKPDRFPVDDIADKPPRAIQYRTPAFNLCMATYLKKFEETLYPELEIGVGRVICKGLDNFSRGALFLRKMERFKKPVFVNFDHSKFDSCVQIEHLRLLHKIYRRAVGKSVQRFLKYQYHNKCYTKTGIKYRTEGTRCSGDFDTGLGNSLINVACVLAVMDGIDFEFMLDGDDTVLIMEQGDEKKINLHKFALFGFKTKISFTSDVHKVEFCQSRFCYVDGQGCFTRNPIRAISNMSISRKVYRPHTAAQYLAGVGLCETAMSSGVPILQQAGIIAQGSSDNAFFDSETLWKMRVHQEKFKRPVTMETRISYHKAWDISPECQIALEESLLHNSIKYFKKCYDYNVEQLFETWARYARLDSTSSSVWWFADPSWVAGLF